MKIVVRERVPKHKYGKIIFTNHDLEVHERDTVFCLASFGFDVETIIPSNIPKSKNPDLLMLGTFWEMKGPRKANRATIQTKFRKARRQAGGRAVFDLRNAVGDKEEIERYVGKLFETTRGMRRIMIIRSDDELLDIFK